MGRLRIASAKTRAWNFISGVSVPEFLALFWEALAGGGNPPLFYQFVFSAGDGVQAEGAAGQGGSRLGTPRCGPLPESLIVFRNSHFYVFRGV
jgi:hypothetical protein